MSTRPSVPRFAVEGSTRTTLPRLAAPSIARVSLAWVACVLLAATPLVGQAVPPVVDDGGVVDPPPVDLARVERARSRACVTAFADFADLERDLEPLVLRAGRLRAIEEAIALEDASGVTPLDASDPFESAVQAWFQADATLGARFVESGDTTVQLQRREARLALVEKLREQLVAVAEAGNGRVAASPEAEARAVACQGVMLVRDQVVEACRSASGPVCQAVGDTTPGPFRFVDRAEDIWDMEELRPWSAPGRIQRMPNGLLGGARTSARGRRGNVTVVLGLAPMLRDRAELDPGRVEEFQANLDSLGFTFEHPRFVMAPALDVQIAVPEPLGGETHYFLHFGDLSDPAHQVLWQTPAGQGGPIQAVFPAAPGALARLQAGEVLSLTAVRVPTADDTATAVEAEAVFSIPLTVVNQARSVGTLLTYMASGDLAQDLRTLVPPAAPAGG